MAKQFLFPVAEQLARTCAYAYAYDPNLKLEIGEGLLQERPIDDGAAKPTSFACVLSYADRTVVCYRGTIPTVPDWVQNFRIDRVPFTVSGAAVGDDGGTVTMSGEVHRGFLDELRGVQAKVLAAVKEFHTDDKTLLVTGHSQGGAVATLGAAALERAGLAVEAAYTFAAPRPGDQTFARAVEKNITIHRVEFGNDIVPHVPPMIPPYLRKLLAGPGGKLILANASPLVKRVMQMSGGGYVGVGRLAYGEPGRFALPNITATQEAELYFDRLRGLIRARDELTDHHSLVYYIACVDKY